MLENGGLYVFLVFFCYYVALTSGDYFEECEGKNGQFIAVQDDCSFYIYCESEDSYRDLCPEDSPYFSISDWSCDIDRNVCGDRPFPNGEFHVEEEDTKPPSTLTSTESSTTESTGLKASTTSTPNSVSTASPSILLTCPPVDDPNKAVFVAHPKSCTEYFLCYHGQRLPMRCSQMLHFDFRQQKCDYAENVKCHVSYTHSHFLSLHFNFLGFSRSRVSSHHVINVYLILMMSILIQ